MKFAGLKDLTSGQIVGKATAEAVAAVQAAIFVCTMVPVITVSGGEIAGQLKIPHASYMPCQTELGVASSVPQGDDSTACWIGR